MIHNNILISYVYYTKIYLKTSKNIQNKYYDLFFRKTIIINYNLAEIIIRKVSEILNIVILFLKNIGR